MAGGGCSANAGVTTAAISLTGSCYRLPAYQNYRADSGSRFLTLTSKTSFISTSDSYNDDAKLTSEDS